MLFLTPPLVLEEPAASKSSTFLYQTGAAPYKTLNYLIFKQQLTLMSTNLFSLNMNDVQLVKGVRIGGVSTPHILTSLTPLFIVNTYNRCSLCTITQHQHNSHQLHYSLHNIQQCTQAIGCCRETDAVCQFLTSFIPFCRRK